MSSVGWGSGTISSSCHIVVVIENIIVPRVYCELVV